MNNQFKKTEARMKQMKKLYLVHDVCTDADKMVIKKEGEKQWTPYLLSNIKNLTTALPF